MRLGVLSLPAISPILCGIGLRKWNGILNENKQILCLAYIESDNIDERSDILKLNNPVNVSDEGLRVASQTALSNVVETRLGLK